MKIIFATTNLHKLKEVRQIFGFTPKELPGLQDFPLIDEIPETGKSFVENAIIKAKVVYSILKLPVIADDSGIEVEHLEGEPGIYSARYAGINATDSDNNKKVIEKLEPFNPPYNARYVCSAVYFDGTYLISSEGYCKGEIIKEPRGNNGFGYDPHFIPTGYNVTMAELPIEVKNKISHRFSAFSKLKELLNEKIDL